MHFSAIRSRSLSFFALILISANFAQAQDQNTDLKLYPQLSPTEQEQYYNHHDGNKDYADAKADDEKMRQEAIQLQSEAIEDIKDKLENGGEAEKELLKSSLSNGSYVFTRQSDFSKVNVLRSGKNGEKYFSAIELDYRVYPRSRNIGFFIYNDPFKDMTDKQVRKSARMVQKLNSAMYEKSKEQPGFIKNLARKFSKLNPFFKTKAKKSQDFDQSDLKDYAKNSDTSTSETRVLFAANDPNFKRFLANFHFSMNLQLIELDEDGKEIGASYRTKPSAISLKKLQLFFQKIYETPEKENFYLGKTCGSLQGIITFAISKSLNPAIWSYSFGMTLGVFGNTMANFIYTGGFYRRMIKSGIVSFTFAAVLLLIKDYDGFFTSKTAKIISSNFFINLYAKDVATYAIPRFRRLMGWSKGFMVSLEMQSFYHLLFIPKMAHILNDDFTSSHYFGSVGVVAVLSLAYQKFYHTKYKTLIANQNFSDEMDKLIKSEGFFKRFMYTANKMKHRFFAKRYNISEDLIPTDEELRLEKKITKLMRDYYSALSAGTLFNKNFNAAVHNVFTRTKNFFGPKQTKAAEVDETKTCHSSFRYSSITK